MLTVFSIPKDFKGHFKVIQTNAIKSWKSMRPSPEIILFGDEHGTARAATRCSVRHHADVARNEYGTPLLDDLFHQADKLATSPYLCYVNSDIILMNDFMEAFLRLASMKKRFLMVGQRVDVFVNEPLIFDENWEGRLRQLAHRTGELYAGIDYFVYPRGLWDYIPPFAIGRLHWDNWLPYAARLQKAATIDATAVVLAVHQNHEHAKGALGGLESQRNRELMAGSRFFTTTESTHALTSAGLKVRCRSCDPVCVCNPDLD
ncbi:hypothetical protein [Bradyrhizobium sp. BWC-3-1]|uniref:hypothetical protein n=1 Tax=Bradyrhizobium sp. BWC-3-1 TaxID=3080012 RepID=UPI00293E0EFB|nr:hypothetical protein [Bradyrhizobium sp. BWC-3-1]WOH57005.1 hypothetical protein RX329_32905 [Bradyrhizobium sp. BWC-3-1]